MLRLAAAIVLSSAAAAETFPLAFRNSWTYRDAGTGDEFTITVGAPLELGGRLYYPLVGYAQEPAPARFDEARNALKYFDEARGEEGLLAAFRPAAWEAAMRSCVRSARTLDERGVHDGPAGPFRGTVDVRYGDPVCADAGVLEEQFAENIGMVRRTVQSFAGPRRYDLVRARIGNQTIEAQPFGRFTVTVAPAADRAMRNAVLRLETSGDAPITLRFPSAQEYDVRLRDSSGRILWTWSADKLFAQAAHEKIVDREWTATIAVPRPENVAAYLVEGWLTTAPGEPMFAATAAAAQ